MVGILVMQLLLLLAHWFLFHSVVVFFPLFWGSAGAGATLVLRLLLLVLAFSFMAAALLSYRFANPFVIAIYKVAAVWLGFLNFFFFAACLSWLAKLGLAVAGQPGNRSWVPAVFFAAAFVAGSYGIANARWARLRRVAVTLENLPPSWRGRTALVMSDLHLGHVNGLGFCRKVVRRAARLKPEIVLIPGDLFDGGKVDVTRLVAPFAQLTPPFGIYFTTGNHDEFGDVAEYTEALSAAGVRVLDGEKVTLDGLQLLGVAYNESTYPLHLRATLESLHLKRNQASILLNHVPNRLPIVEQAGIGLQLSGHTHGGQIFPYNWFTRRIFGKFTYGLQTFGSMQVYTSSGAGTWGPPMRVGTHPEMVLLTFA